jgi:hypothetical protein
MAKKVSDSVLDAVLDKIAECDQLVLCEGEPADYAAATADKGSGGVALGEIGIDSGDFGKADGDVSGRKVTVAQQTPVPVDVSGDWDHVALVDDGTSDLRLVTMLPNADIVAVNQGTKTFTIDGDHTSDLQNGDRVTVRDSTGNDGGYDVDSVALNGSDTDVTVDQSIPSATADGIMIHGAQKVTAGNNVTVNAFADELRDPV